MTEIVKGLFGFSPQELSMQRDQQDQASALAQAKLSNTEFANYAITRGAGQLARGVRGMMGAQDPEMQKASDLQNLLKTGDFNTVEGATSMAKQAASLGYGNEAQQMYAHAQGLRKSAADLGLTDAQTKKASREGNAAMLTTEQRNAAALADSSGAEKGTPEWAATYNTELARLTTKAGGEPKKVGIAEGSRKVVFQDPSTDQLFIYEQGKDGKQVRVPYNGGVDQLTSKVNVSSVNKGADAGAMAIAKLDATRLEGAQAASDKAIESGSVLQQLANTPQDVVGAGAPARVAALRVFSTIGLTSAKDNAALGNADTFNTLAGERVLSFIKTLGTNPTDTDREFARSIGPALEKGTKTNQDLVAYLLKRANETVTAAKAMETHFYENNYSLRGYVSPFVSNLKTKNPLQGLSDAELAAKIEAARKPK